MFIFRWTNIFNNFFYLLYMLVAVILTQILISLGCGWMAPTQAKLNQPGFPLQMTLEEASWFASIHDLGKIVGPLLTPLLADNIGRRYTLLLTTVCCFLSFFSLIFARDIYILYAARILYGVGETDSSTPFAESTLPKIVRLTIVDWSVV